MNYSVMGHYNCRYAHSSVQISPNCIVSIGGFGVDSNNRHRRLDDVLSITVECDYCTIRKIKVSGLGPGNPWTILALL